MIPDKLLRMKEVSTLLGVTSQTLRNWSKEGYVQAVVGKGGTELVVVNSVESDYKQEISEDMMAIIVHFSSRLYGKRRWKKKSTQIKQILKHSEN